MTESGRKAAEERAEREALAAVLPILAPFANEADIAPDEGARSVLQAVKAVDDVAAAAQAALFREDKDSYLDLDSAAIVATGLWCVTHHLDEDPEIPVHPYVIGAQPFLAFARACILLEAASMLSAQAEDIIEWPIRTNCVDQALAAIPVSKETNGEPETEP